MQVIRAAAVKRRRQKPASVLALDEMRDCFLLQTVSYLLFDVLCVSGNAHGKLLENFRLKVTLIWYLDFNMRTKAPEKVSII